jgi:hypothetical protein
VPPSVLYIALGLTKKSSRPESTRVRMAHTQPQMLMGLDLPLVNSSSEAFPIKASDHSLRNSSLASHNGDRRILTLMAASPHIQY